MELYIDVETKAGRKLYNGLKKLKTTHYIEEPAMYHMDNSFSRILIDTDLTEDQMDERLYKVKYAIGYIGVITNKSHMRDKEIA